MAWVTHQQLANMKNQMMCSLAGPAEWNALPWGIGKGMKGGWDQAKGKGKGEKGTKGKGNTGKYGGKASKGKGGTDGVACGCCGKFNHVKAECLHKLKLCNHCGVAGHLDRICKKKMAAANQDAVPDQVAAAPKSNAAPLVPWMCLDCGQRNQSDKKRMCTTRYCTGTCPVSYKEAAEKSEAAPSAVSPKTQGHIDEAAPEKVQATADELKEEIVGLKADIARFKKPLYPNGKPLQSTITELQTAIAEKEKQVRLVLDTGAPVFKGMAGDHAREKHNHEQKMNKMEADLKELEEKESNGRKYKEEKLEAEQKRHFEAMASLEK